MQTEVFDFTHYKSYLKNVLTTSGVGRGQRSQLAAYLNCQGAFISQVLNGDSHFSFEHAFKIAAFLSLGEKQREYFMLLVQKDRAGSRDLENFYKDQLQKMKDQRKISEQIKVETELDLEAKSIYYSSWIYAAIHILISVPEFQHPTKLSGHLGLTLSEVTDVLDFLCSVGLANKSRDLYKIGSARVHLDSQSPLIRKHHMNWRLKAMQDLERQNKSNLNYSLILSASEADIEKIKTHILRFIDEVEKIYLPSKEEKVQCLSFDFFSV